MTLDKVYAPKNFEDKWYSYWLKNKYFHSEPNKNKKPYTMVIPPPNITGILTMGHVLNNTIQDILVRWHRMKGFETCWIPGTDHAGIATQVKVEKLLAEQNIDKNILGREKFVEKLYEWKDKYGGIIIQQLKKLGCSCDWDRERYTMDEGLSRAVRETFIHLFNKGLIYKGERIVNWCPKSKTAISDDEVVHKEKTSKLWYFRYPIKDTNEYVVIATTRPETMLGDTGVAVNPNDVRYKHLVGKTIILPIVKRNIPIVADEHVNPEFGTGVVKVTPSHDPNDFEIGKRHNLQFINIMNKDASLNENAGKDFEGMDRFIARKAVLKKLDELGCLDKIEDYTHKVAYSDRGDVPIEPLVSKQWFIRMEELAKPALKVVQEGKIKFHPEHWVKTYEHWMKNIRDWCISRQLWWGHRIPVWYCDETGEVFTSHDEPKTSPSGNPNIYQDEDVLDTWVSSWLWPFSLHDWPNKSEALDYYYPTNVLVTAPDIIFFWVARMIMAGLEFMHSIPFEHVYFTGLIRDEQGRKMSKTLGNSPDPLKVIDEYGTDAIRFTVIYITPVGNDILYSNKKCEIGRNFANKIWNAARFLLMNKEQHGFGEYSLTHLEGSDELVDKWILSRFHKTIQNVNTAIDLFKLTDALKELYNFIWKDFCDWYIEIIKIRLNNNDDVEMKKSLIASVIYMFDNTLRLLHSFMPFITEEIWQSLYEKNNEDSIMIQPIPELNISFIDEAINAEMELVHEIIEAIRSVRGSYNISPAKTADVIIKTKNQALNRFKDIIKTLSKVGNLTIEQEIAKPKLATTSVVRDIEIYVLLEGLIDITKEKNKINKEITQNQNQVSNIQKKLSNEKFLSNAPEHVVNQEKERLNQFQEKIKILQNDLKSYE